MLKEQLFVILILNIHISSRASDVIYDTAKQVWNLYSVIDELDSKPCIDTDNEQCNFYYLAIQNMRSKMDEIHEKLGDIKDYIRVKKIWDAVQSWPLDAAILKNINSFDRLIEENHNYYERFHLYRSANFYYYTPSFESYIDEISNGVAPGILTIRSIITEGENSSSHVDNLPLAMAACATIHQTQLRGDALTVSGVLMLLFRMVMVAEIQATTMLAFANVHRYIMNDRRPVSRTANLEAREQFEEQVPTYLNVFSPIFLISDNIYWMAADPDHNKWIRDETFFELEQTFHTSLLRYHWYACKHNSCDDVRINRARQCDSRIYDRRSSCEGTISGCAYLNAIQACVSKQGPHKFQYVNSTELGFFGSNSTCSKTDAYIIEDGAGWDIVNAACLCNCYNNQSEISLSMVESNVRLNHVVVGLRFVRSNRVLCIQVREARLGSHGFINRYAQRWIPLAMSISADKTQPIDAKKNVFFFDDVRLPPGHVLTGVKFNMVTRGTVSGFSIKIFGRKVDYETGKLVLGENSRISRTSSDTNPGTPLSFTPVSSIYAALPNTVSPANIKYVALKQSRLKEDFGQSTLPQFDGVSISLQIPSALDGVGVFHKGARGYAGFISLRVYGIRLDQYFRDFKAAHMIDNRVLFNVSYDP